MHPLPLHLGPGSDLRASLEQVAIEAEASGFVLGVVGDLSQAAFQCPGQDEPTLLAGPSGDHHPAGHRGAPGGAPAPEPFRRRLPGVGRSPGARQPGDEGRRPAGGVPGERRCLGAGVAGGCRPVHGAPPAHEPVVPRVEIAVRSGCPFSARALRMLRTLGIPHEVQLADGDAERQAIAQRSGRGSLPQVFIDGEAIGGYDALADLHGRGALDPLR